MNSRLNKAPRLQFSGVSLVLLCAAVPLLSQVVPRNEYALLNNVVSPPGYVATVAPQNLLQVQAEMDAATLQQVADFRVEAGSQWQFYVDRRSGGMALVEGQGIAWIPGRGNGLDPQTVRGSAPDGGFTARDLEPKARDLMIRYPGFFKVPNAQWVLDEKASVNEDADHHLWSLLFRQMSGTVTVDGAIAFFHVAHGNLVQFGIDRAIPNLPDVKANPPQISAASAKALLGGYLAGWQPGDLFSESGTLLYVPRGVNDTIGYTGPMGQGWQGDLVYRFTFQRVGQTAGWQGLVDARTGAVTRFVDSNDYASIVKASVYTLTNCSAPYGAGGCVPGTANEAGATLPYARLNFTGGTACTGDACFSNGAGVFNYPAGASAVATSLDGKYFKVVDTCGAVAAAAAAPGNIDLGTSLDTVAHTNTDCQSATQASPPGSGAVSGGSGDTHSARNTFYHLNLMNQKARFYLPTNQWLKGVDGSGGTGAAVLVTTNIAPACNAFWQGGVGSLNFEQKTTALFCNNTGEIPGVFLHEFGHGLDQNDATGTAPESATGEAMGDTFSILETQISCLGPGFRLQDPTDTVWGDKAGYGNSTTGSSAQTCSGVRDADYTRYCARDALGCLSQAAAQLRETEPGSVVVQGSHSGPNPNLAAPDAGTPARWDTMIATGAYVPTPNDGKINFYNCGPDETTGCPGPLGHGCHCESTIASQANWDLVKQLIKTEFGGNIYAAPQGPTEVSGWQYIDRLWYLTRDSAVSAYSVTGAAPSGTTNGCGGSNWFSTYRFVDDDDGNLANGTPHADILYTAFNLHAMACGLSGDPSNQATGCPAPIAAPTLTACPGKSPVQLTWSASPGAGQYRVLRNTLGCGFGFKPLALLNGNQLAYEDNDVAPGSTYYFSVQPVGTNPSCYGQASNCLAVTPTTCSAVGTPNPATNVVLATPANNQIQVSWTASTSPVSNYKIYRKDGNCAGGGSYALVGLVPGGQTSFTDTTGLQGTFTYSYQVTAVGTTCAACDSTPTACQSTVATGPCQLAPSFSGVASVGAAPQGQCRLTAGWSAGSAVCGSTLTYNVYRSTDPFFTPGAGSLLASGVSGTSYVDNAVQGGTQYFYAVRAKDAYGNTDGNTVRRGETPVGGLTPGTYADNAGDTGTAKLSRNLQDSVNAWAIRANDGTADATKVYATTASGMYDTNACARLESNTVQLGTGASLSFSSRYDMEQGWDGGYVEVSTEAGGFTNWTKLSTINYPGVMSGPLGDPACGGAGFADGAPVFTGTSAAGAYATFTGSLSAYNGQRIRIAFRFSSDSSTVAEGWFLDNIQITNAQLPGSCIGEVSGNGSNPHILRLQKASGTNLNLIFEDTGGLPNKYNVYEGALGTWYSHGASGGQCNVATTAASGDRTSSGYTPATGPRYFLVDVSNGVTEGVLGYDSSGAAIPAGVPACGP